MNEGNTSEFYGKSITPFNLSIEYVPSRRIFKVGSIDPQLARKKSDIQFI